MRYEIFISREIKPDFISRMIMKVIKAPFSHIGVLVNGRDIYHATGRGFHKTSLEAFNQKKEIVGLKTVEVHSKQFSLGFLEGRIGTDYAEMQYLGFLMPALRKLLKNGGEKGICSEETARFLNKCAKGFDFQGVDFLDPKQVWDKI